MNIARMTVAGMSSPAAVTVSSRLNVCVARLSFHSSSPSRLRTQPFAITSLTARSALFWASCGVTSPAKAFSISFAKA